MPVRSRPPMQWKSTPPGRAVTIAERAARTLGHGLEVRQEVQRRANESVVPVAFPEPLVLEPVEVHGDGRDPTGAARGIPGPLAGLAKIDDSSDAGGPHLVPAGRLYPVEVLGTEEHPFWCGLTGTSSKTAEVSGVSQSLDPQSAVARLRDSLKATG